VSQWGKTFTTGISTSGKPDGRPEALKGKRLRL
jgi:hypothetical protein